jgi:dipeptidase E
MTKGLTLPIDREIVRFTGKSNPRALFIPTASGEPADYIAGFQNIYGKKLGCRVDVLYLLKNRPSPLEMRSRIERADLIYVGGGNTLMMMRRWRHLGVDFLLRRAAHAGKVLAGTSAGAICWFRWGHSDSWFYYKHCPRKYIRVKGLGLVHGTFCPHYHGEKRERDFARMLTRKGGAGIAVNDRCAIQILGRRFRILKAAGSTDAYSLRRKDDKVARETLNNEGFLKNALGG